MIWLQLRWIRIGKAANGNKILNGGAAAAKRFKVTDIAPVNAIEVYASIFTSSRKSLSLKKHIHADLCLLVEINCGIWYASFYCFILVECTQI